MSINSSCTVVFFLQYLMNAEYVMNNWCYVRVPIHDYHPLYVG